MRLEKFWSDARDRIAKLRRIDTGCQLVFGASGHRYATPDPVDEARLAAFEAANAVSLPAEYRAFLTTFGSGGAGPDYGIYDFGRVESVSVKERFFLTKSTPWPDNDDDPMWKRPGLLPVSTSGCAIDWSIEVNGPQPGTMWVDAGPGDQLMRCESFGTWYADWLDRIEHGVQTYSVVSKMAESGSTLAEIAEAIGIEPYKSTWDGETLHGFRGVPGRIRLDGERVGSMDFGVNKLI